jgi:hypothetical protein
MHWSKIYTRIIFCGLSCGLLISCATNPVNLVPKEDPPPGVVTSTQQSVSVESMLARVRNPEQANQASLVNNSLDPIVTLHYTEKQKVLLPIQKQQLGSLLTAYENSGLSGNMLVHIGPGDIKDPISSLRIGQHRARFLQQYLKENGIESKTNYDPHLPVGVIVVQLEEQGGTDGH